MKASGRNYRITIQRAMTTQDPDSGQPVEAWGMLATVYADKSYRSAKEGMLAGGVQSIRVLRFAILWSNTVKDVSPLDRIEFPVGSGVLYDITEANEIGFHEGVELFAQARSETPDA
jgi:head-tail adaptor